MQNMPNMLAYTIVGSLYPGVAPWITIGQKTSMKSIRPNTPADDSYWIVFLDQNNPTNKVKEFVVPGQNNSTVPAGLDTYMIAPGYIFAVVTQYLSTLHVPQGDFYDYLVKFGSGRALQRLEQILTSLNCGYIGHVSYMLTGQSGPRGSGIVSPPSYELVEPFKSVPPC
jgi:hypothetical protein